MFSKQVAKMAKQAKVLAKKKFYQVGSTLCELCSTQYYWDVLCASFVVQSSTGKYFVRAL